MDSTTVCPVKLSSIFIQLMDWEFPVLSLWWRKLFTPSCNTPCIMLNKNGLQSPELGDFTQSRSWIMEPVLRYPCPALLAQGWIRIMKALKTKLTFTRFRQRDRSHFYGKSHDAPLPSASLFFTFPPWWLPPRKKTHYKKTIDLEKN